MTCELPKDPSVPVTQGPFHVSSRQMRENLMGASDKDIKIELPQQVLACVLHRPSGRYKVLKHFLCQVTVRELKEGKYFRR